MRTYFAIASSGRSGSTYLERLLDSHPQIICLGEVFCPGSPYATGSNISPVTAITEMMFGGADGVVGFKLPWENFIETPGMLDTLRNLEFRLIHLWRRNKLDQVLSIALARHNNQWWPDGAYREQTIVLDPAWAVDQMYALIDIDEQWRSICKEFPSITVEYEALIRGEAQAAIQQFLGVDRVDLHSGIARARLLPRRHAIVNFDELATHFSSTPAAVFFDDDEHLYEG